MGLDDASLTDLMAELRERLRSFISALPASRATAGPEPLGPAGRAALAVRLLAVVLGGRGGIAAVEAAAAFSDFAEALVSTPEPLPGSALDDALRLLAADLEAMAIACEQHDGVDLAGAWRHVRDHGDRLWGVAAPSVAAPLPPAPAAVDGVETPPPAAAADATRVPLQTECWLMIGGAMRRSMLHGRLEAAGLRVSSFDNLDAVLERLDVEPPAALICDDAAPHRFATRLRSRLRLPAPPLILVRGRPDPADVGQIVWLPPYCAEDLLARIGG